ncbi:MAG: hypothetical protein FJW96_10215 [Actinobacteria bacterium]|nr:hypothetical protein [Actinomycetota bacterium]
MARAIERAKSEPWLVASDANAIQEFVLASSRPIAMQGASALIEETDRALCADPATVFAGGGRALQVVSGAERQQRAESLVANFRHATGGGVLSVALAPYDATQPEQSLAWLRQRLTIAKDMAPAPDFGLAGPGDRQCTDCGVRRAEHPSPRPDAGEDRICSRCLKSVRAGQKDRRRDEGWTIDEVAEQSKIAVVSADGNNLGAFFAGLPSLVAQAVGSELVTKIFERAHGDAAPGNPHVAPITGGDDIRVFLRPSDLLGYVQKLGSAVERHARAEAGRRDLPLPDDAMGRLGKLSIGIGAVVADHHLPAYRLIEFAHLLEQSAKRKSRTTAGSTFDFAILTSGDELLQGRPTRSAGDRRPYLVSQLAAETERASALLRVPRSQWSILDDGLPGSGASGDEAELANLLRYQVSRNEDWQRWYTSCGVEWRNPGEVVRGRPDRGTMALASLVLMARGSAA